jgi:hypothetical protein
MFLKYLSDSDKERFIELAYKLAYANRDFPEVQRKLLGRYKEECGIRFIPNTTTKEELIAYFGGHSEEIKRIVYYEIYMLLISDDQIDADEMKVLRELRAAFGFSDEEAEKIQELGLTLKQTSHDLKKILGIADL